MMSFRKSLMAAVMTAGVCLSAGDVYAQSATTNPPLVGGVAAATPLPLSVAIGINDRAQDRAQVLAFARQQMQRFPANAAQIAALAAAANADVATDVTRAAVPLTTDSAGLAATVSLAAPVQAGAIAAVVAQSNPTEAASITAATISAAGAQNDQAVEVTRSVMNVIPAANVSEVVATATALVSTPGAALEIASSGVQAASGNAVAVAEVAVAARNAGTNVDQQAQQAVGGAGNLAAAESQGRDATTLSNQAGVALTRAETSVAVASSTVGAGAGAPGGAAVAGPGGPGGLGGTAAQAANNAAAQAGAQVTAQADQSADIDTGTDAGDDGNETVDTFSDLDDGGTGGGNVVGDLDESVADAVVVADTDNDESPS